jgi:hypothetical protein
MEECLLGKEYWGQKISEFKKQQQKKALEGGGDVIVHMEVEGINEGEIQQGGAYRRQPMWRGQRRV